VCDFDTLTSKGRCPVISAEAACDGDSGLGIESAPSSPNPLSLPNAAQAPTPANPAASLSPTFSTTLQCSDGAMGTQGSRPRWKLVVVLGPSDREGRRGNAAAAFEWTGFRKASRKASTAAEHSAVASTPATGRCGRAVSWRSGLMRCHVMSA